VGEGDDLVEHLPHRQRRADLDADAGLGLAAVGEGVDDAGLDVDHVTGAGLDRAPADAEAHAALEDREALALHGMDVGDRHGAARCEGELEGEQLAAGAGRRVGEGEALARDGVLERLAGSGHAGQ